MSRPFRTISQRYVEARLLNANGEVFLSDSDLDGEPLNSTADNQHRGRNPAGWESGSWGSSYSQDDTANNEQIRRDSAGNIIDEDESKAATVGSRHDPEEQLSENPGPQTANSRPDSGVGGMSTGHPLLSANATPSQLRAWQLFQPNYGTRRTNDTPQSADNSSNGPSDGPPQGGQTSILQRTEQLQQNNHIPRAPSVNTQASTDSIVETKELPSGLNEDEQTDKLLEVNFDPASDNSHQNNHSREVSNAQGPDASTNQTLVHSPTTGLPPPCTNDLPTTEGLRRSKTTAIPSQKCSTSYALSYSIDDTAQAFKQIEEQHEKDLAAMLNGHLDKAFGIEPGPEVKDVGALKIVQLVNSRVEEWQKPQKGEVEGGGCLRKLMQKIKEKWRAGKRRLKANALGSRRGGGPGLGNLIGDRS
jgi:hypothetical protein